MRGEAAATLCLEHLVGQHILLGELPVRPDLRRVDVLVDFGAGLSRAFAAAALQIELVHLALVPILEIAFPRVAPVAWRVQVYLLKWNVLVSRWQLFHPLSRSIGTG